MKGKIALVVGGAVGYVLGTRAGRERYDQIVARARDLWENPRVQEAASQAPSQAQRAASAASAKLGGQHRDGSGVTPPTETYPNAGSAPGDVGI